MFRRLRHRSPASRKTRFELLESRSLFAADIVESAASELANSEQSFAAPACDISDANYGPVHAGQNCPQPVPIQEHTDPLDVNRDGRISRDDAQSITDELERNGSGPHDGPLDVNCDGFVSPLDALMILNVLDDLAKPPSSFSSEDPPALVPGKVFPLDANQTFIVDSPSTGRLVQPNGKVQYFTDVEFVRDPNSARCNQDGCLSTRMLAPTPTGKQLIGGYIVPLEGEILSARFLLYGLPDSRETQPEGEAASSGDVNRDGQITSDDLQQIVDELERNGSRLYDGWLDVNSDGFLSPLDALMVANQLQGK